MASTPYTLVIPNRQIILRGMSCLYRGNIILLILRAMSTCAVQLLLCLLAKDIAIVIRYEGKGLIFV